MPILHGYGLRRVNFYDTFLMDANHHSTLQANGQWLFHHSTLQANGQWLFGNANIGREDFCNLYVAGQLALDEAVVIEHWYARTDIDIPGLNKDERSALQQWSAITTVRFIVGDRPQWCRPLQEMLADRPWEPPSVAETNGTPAEIEAYKARAAKREVEGAGPIVIPVRQNAAVVVDPHASPLHQEVLTRVRRFRVWIHLEGHRVRDSG